MWMDKKKKENCQKLLQILRKRKAKAEIFQATAKEKNIGRREK